MAEPTFTVGQKVWIYDVNRRRGQGPQEGTVTKVGRKLVTVQVGTHWSWTFRIEDGSRNDRYGHQWVKTDEQRKVEEHRNDLLRRLAEGGLEVRIGRMIATEGLERLVAALDG